MAVAPVPDPDPNALFDEATHGNKAPTLVDPPNLLALNTHAIGWTGLALVALGLFGPAAIDAHAHSLLSPYAAAAHQFGAVLISVGASAAYVGRPFSVAAGKPPAPPENT